MMSFRSDWRVLSAPIPNMQMWGLFDGTRSFVISRDTGCQPDDRFHGRFALSVQGPDGQTVHLGTHDTLKAAQVAARKAMQ